MSNEMNYDGNVFGSPYYDYEKNSAKEKRYLITTQHYVMATSEDEATEIAREWCAKIDVNEDNKINVIATDEAPFGKIY